MRLSDINTLNKSQKITVFAPEFSWHTEKREVTLREGSAVVFSTRFHAGTGVVLSIDHAYAFPIKIEFYEGNDKRIVTFGLDEFKSLRIE